MQQSVCLNDALKSCSLMAEFDLKSWTIKAVAIGDVFDTKIHACGTEIKAITYSAMQIYNGKDDRKNAKGAAELYVIVDI